MTDRRLSVSATIAVPVLLAGLSGVENATHMRITDYLVLPPLAVVIFLIFRDPAGEAANGRSIVLLPCLGAIVGQLSAFYFGLTPLGIATATACVLLLQTITDAFMPPALALCVLALILHADPVTYVVGVFEATAAIFCVFYVWRAFVYRPFLEEPR